MSDLHAGVFTLLAAVALVVFILVMFGDQDE